MKNNIGVLFFVPLMAKKNFSLTCTKDSIIYSVKTKHNTPFYELAIFSLGGMICREKCLYLPD